MKPKRVRISRGSTWREKRHPENVWEVLGTYSENVRTRMANNPTGKVHTIKKKDLLIYHDKVENYQNTMENEKSTNNEPLVAPVTDEQTPSATGIPMMEPHASFLKYVAEHPGESFWQALRNWSGEDFIFTGNLTNKKGTNVQTILDGMRIYLEDTINK